MLLGSCPRLLVLALLLPEMSHALGLGHMRVESKLNEPLLAQIDIIGATADELQAIRASVANPEVFRRYEAERPAFLSSATISVGTNATGRPVLNIQSSEAFTEPLVEFLIDVRSGKQELLRDYSLLLDPARATPAVSATDSAASNGASALELQTPSLDIPGIVPVSARIGPPIPPQIVRAADPVAVHAGDPYRVLAHDSLRGIARHAGARSEAAQQRMMLAIFTANPEAFAGNINRLRSGALIKIPSAAEIQVFDSADVEREIRAQTTAWQRRGRPATLREPAPLALVPSEALAARKSAPEGTEVPAMTAAMDRLEAHVRVLQQNLDEANRQLASATEQTRDVQHRPRKQADVAGTASAVRLTPGTGKVPWGAEWWGLAFLLGALAYGWRRFRSDRSLVRTPVSAEEPTIEVPVIQALSVGVASSRTDRNEAYSVTESVLESLPAAALAGAGAPLGAESADWSGATAEMAQVVDIDVDTVEEPGPGGSDDIDTVVMETLEPHTADATSTVLDYNLSDLDGRAQHVEMPGTLRDQAAIVERRKNVVDTLMAALQSDPTRSDLRMKLLETLYTAAATNLRVFKEVVRGLARHPDRVKGDEWEQIMAMGREIAADDALFADQPAEDKIADCA
jgi:pilus assembly protein FimV